MKFHDYLHSLGMSLAHLTLGARGFFFLLFRMKKERRIYAIVKNHFKHLLSFHFKSEIAVHLTWKNNSDVTISRHSLSHQVCFGLPVWFNLTVKYFVNCMASNKCVYLSIHQIHVSVSRGL